LLNALATEPPLPEGAYPEWSLAKAWQQSSSARGKVCLNGLWQFRSEPRLAPVEEVETFFADGIEPDTINAWDVGTIRGGTVRTSVDTERKKEGSASMKVELDIPKATNFYHLTRVVRGIPTGTKLVLRADMWLEMERGDLHLEIQDARDYKFYTGRCGAFPKKDGWQTVECEFILPSDTTAAKILILRNHGSSSGCKGTVWIDNLRIAKVEHPAAAGIAPPTDDAWGYTKVPGSWQGRVYWNEEDPGRRNPSGLQFGWFRRSVEVPADWTGRRIQVELDRVATDAKVYCDGELAGQVGYMGGMVDVTHWAKPGETLDLAVLVEARNAWIVMPTLLTRPSKSWQARLYAKGIVGDVFLTSEPMQMKLGDCRIVTSVADHRLTVSVPLTIPLGIDIPGDFFSLRCEVRDGDRVVKSFTQVVPPRQRVSISDTWPDAELWDVGKPRLYALTLTLLGGGKVVDQSLPQTFGFRDFEIRGKFFYLNDVKLNLVPCAYWPRKGNWGTKEAMRHWVKGAMAAGYNYVYLEEVDRPGRHAVTGHFLEVCDELGMLAAISPLSIGHSAYARLDRDEVWTPWTRVVEQCVRQNWNHPSLVMWRMNMNLNCYKQDQNPLVLDGKMDFEPDSTSARKEAAMLKSNAFVRSLDPTRPTYNHACGKTGEIYNLNNYLGWPELQDLREWLRVWSQNADKPLFMAEQATPYPGDFQMRDPTNWWTNEPVMTEYGAILLGEKSYALEEQDYVDYYDRCWDAKGGKWRSSYGYFCHNYPPILDECSSDYYDAMLPAWRTWGISGGVNAWENTWRRLIKRQPNTSYRATPPNVPLPTDWASLQRPGFSADEWVYANGGGGEIRCLFDLGRPEEKEYFEPTRRGKVMPELIAPLYAYIGGPEKEWYAQDHAFRSGETVEKSVVLLNDRRKPVTFEVKWQAFAADQPTQGGTFSRTVAPAESAVAAFAFRAPTVTDRAAGRLVADVTVAGKPVPVKPFALEFYPPRTVVSRALAGWALFDPEGKTQRAMRAAGLVVPGLAATDSLPDDVRVLVVGCNSLAAVAGSKLAENLSGRVASGLQVVVFEQPAEALATVFGLRCFTPGVRRVWVRDGTDPILAGLSNADLRNWRGSTTLGPLAGPPESLDQVQRWERVWRCSQLGVVASTVVEKPQVSSFRPLLDTGFDLRYTPLWETTDGTGRMVFCQLDVTDRIGLDPVADRLLANLVGSLQDWQPGPTRSPQLVRAMTDAPFARLDANQGACPTDAKGAVVILPRGCEGWLSLHGSSLRPFLRSGGTVLAAGLSAAEAKVLLAQAGADAEAGSAPRWLNPLHGDLPPAFRGVGPAAVHWRRKLDAVSATRVPAGGWRSETGVLATIPVGKGEIVWVSALPGDFAVDHRPDLVFSRVNTERLYTIVLGNLGVRTGEPWASWLAPGAPPASQKAFYTDTRVPRDDPYADMRW
jgi:beta-galactosidase